MAPRRQKIQQPLHKREANLITDLWVTLKHRISQPLKFFRCNLKLFGDLSLRSIEETVNISAIWKAHPEEHRLAESIPSLNTHFYVLLCYVALRVAVNDDSLSSAATLFLNLSFFPPSWQCLSFFHEICFFIKPYENKANNIPLNLKRLCLLPLPQMVVSSPVSSVFQLPLKHRFYFPV